MCVLSDSCHGRDALEHYLVCPSVWSTIFHRMRINSAPRSRTRLMLLEKTSNEDAVALACIIYSIRRTVHTLRANNARCRPDDLGDYLWQAVKIAAVYHTNVARYIRELWTR